MSPENISESTPPSYAPPAQTATAVSSSITKDEDPGLALGVAAMAFIFSGLQLIGLILAVIGMKRSKEAGFSGSVSRIAMILNIVGIVLIALLLMFYIGLFILGAASNNS